MFLPMKLTHRAKLGVGLLCALCLATEPAAASETVESQAAALHELYIFKGDASSFRQQSRLERSEAAAYVVRLDGSEQEALHLKRSLENTGFTDVDVDDWYAPYVVQASESSIIKGFPDQTFRAEEYVSEQEFVKMVLAVLGYPQGTDFEWNDVYSKAEEIGLLDDARTQRDEEGFTKAGAVRYLYRALQLPRKDSEKLLIEELVERGAISEDTAEELNLLPSEERPASQE